MAKGSGGRKTVAKHWPKVNPEGPSLARGPKKERPTGGVPPRATTHKARSVWFQARCSWPFREAPAHIVIAERARIHADMSPQSGATQWELVGPTNVGGRMTSVACDPHAPDVIYGGAAGGGVWKSDDGGQHWRSLWHNQPTLNVGSIAVDPNNPSIVYCGTGEANLSADSYPGIGVFRSLDGGTNWQVLAPASSTGIPTRIGVLAVDPFDSNHLALGGVTHSQDGSDGMFVSLDGGVSWARLAFGAPGPYRCHSIVFNPARRGTLFATINARGAQSGIWKSTNGGAAWTHLSGGLPSPSSMGRTSLAIAVSNPDVLYAISSDGNDQVLGVFKSMDGGASWANVAGVHFAQEGQMSYGNTIAVHPTNPDHVLCGGVDLHITRDGGKTWAQATKWDANRGESNYAHADHHSLLMPVARPGRVYDMNDGGMDVSADGGVTWSNRSNGLAATMFYDLDVGQSDGRMFGGGAQDNGTNITLTGNDDDFVEITGGDGGWMLIDPTTNNHLYTTSQFMSVYRFRAQNGWTVVSPPADSSETGRVWMVFLDMDPGDPQTVFAGGLRVWRTTDDGVDWQAVSDVLDGSAITAVEIAIADSKTIYVGTENGGFFRSTDGGNSWSADLSSAVLPGFTITRILTDPKDSRTVFTTSANFGKPHMFRSNDGGQTWKDIDRGQLPNVPHHALAIPRATPATVYVANDVGVFVSTDAGDNWNNLSRNLPNVPIVDLVYHEHDRTLTAASYGRSLWRLKV
jgi:photosystem II stability/assembly factor-like uncharacterized protein